MLPVTFAVEEKLTVFENVTCAATLIEDAYDASDSMRSTIIVPAIFYPNSLFTLLGIWF
jgi:hypothetical protein